MRCHCGQEFKGPLAGVRLVAHQNKDHPKNPNNVTPPKGR
jgi:hypothetical protein